MKRIILGAGVLAVLLFASPADAQTGTAGATGTTSLTDADFVVRFQKEEGVFLAPFDVDRLFNKANCDCDVPIWIDIDLSATGAAKRGQLAGQTGKIDLFLGNLCNTPLYQPGCFSLGEVLLQNFLNTRPWRIKTDARTLSSSSSTAADVDGGVTTTGSFVLTKDCTSASAEFNQNLWIVVDTGSDGFVDGQKQVSFRIDLTPPPAPENINVSPGNEAVVVNWSAVDFATNMDLQGYQVLCRRGADLQVFADNTFKPYYKTCDKTGVSGGIEGLDPLFACSNLLTKSATSFRVKILQNGIPYAATVVSIDNNGNASPPMLINQVDGAGNVVGRTNFATPAITRSFYDEYRNGTSSGQMTDEPGQAAGGLCNVGPETRPAISGLAAGGLALGVAAFAWSRRRRRR